MTSEEDEKGAEVKYDEISVGCKRDMGGGYRVEEGGSELLKKMNRSNPCWQM